MYLAALMDFTAGRILAMTHDPILNGFALRISLFTGELT
jgi:hypothetical protein